VANGPGSRWTAANSNGVTLEESVPELSLARVVNGQAPRADVAAIACNTLRLSAFGSDPAMEDPVFYNSDNILQPGSRSRNSRARP